MTIATNENSELICKLQNIKRSDKYINFKKSVSRTSSIVRNKLNISYNYSLEDENIDFLIGNFIEICTYIEQLIESLQKFETCNTEFIQSNRSITLSFKELFVKEDYEVFFDIASLRPPLGNTQLEETNFLIQQHHQQTLAIRKQVVLAKKDNSKLCFKRDFNIDFHLENGHDLAIKECKNVFKYFQSAVHTPLVDINNNVFKKFKLAIKHREFLIMDYNRYREKFHHMELKELEKDLNILQEKNYKYFMRKLDDASLEYNIATETIRNDLTLFLNHIFPSFWKLWFEKYYYTVFSLSYVLYENIANSQEINRFSSELGDFVESHEGTEINLKIKDDYRTSMKLFHRITKKRSTLNYLLG